MKYLLPELLWEKGTDTQYEKNLKAYTEQLQTIKDRIHASFWRIYEREQGFHDYFITGFYYTDSNLCITIKHHGDCFKLTYIGVQSYKITMDDLYHNSNAFSWGYDEFLPIDDQLLSHEIVFPSRATFKVIFREAKLTKQKK